MKKSFKAITSLVLMVLVLMSLSVSAFAAAPSPTASITFRGEKQGFGFQSDDMNYTATDLFDSFKNVMPGDQILVLPRVDSKNMQAVKEVSEILYQIAVACKVILDL